MLARRLGLKLDGMEVGTTPMLIPSVSSRVNIDLGRITQIIDGFFSGPFLISSYDVFYSNNFPEITFPDLVFLDSGGYECYKDCEISDIGLYKPNPYVWNKSTHRKAIEKWLNRGATNIKTTLISYDHPTERMSVAQQINQSIELFRDYDNVLREILVKSESQGKNLEITSVIENIEKLGAFDIIGFTEKELGVSVFERMINVAQIRLEMERKGNGIPIHVFGSLDTITTPLYYFSGADIFDGLSWLRFIFHEGKTLYVDSYAPTQYGLKEEVDNSWIRSIFNNHKYLLQLKRDLGAFSSTHAFQGVLKPNSEFFKNSYDKLNEELGGVL